VSARRSKKAAALPKPRKLRRTWPQRMLIGFNVFLVGVCLVTAGGIFYTFNRFGKLPRVELAHVLSPEPQSQAVDKAQNFLLVGSDSRASIDPSDPNIGAFGSESDVGGQRSDTIMVLRIDPASQRASILSFPRDLWVDIAGTGGKQRINTAFSRGPDVLVATLQQNFGIPIQHYVEVDFRGFKGLVDAVGGVPIYFENPARDLNTGLNIPVAGCATLNGDQALAYARSRHYEYKVGNKWRTDGTGDLGRISRQQDFIRRSLKKAVAKGIRNPIVLNNLIDVGVQNVTVDSSLSARDLIRLGNRFRSLDPTKIDMYTVPVTPTTINGAAVLLLQTQAAQSVLDVFRGVTSTTTGTTGGATATAPLTTVQPSTVHVEVLNGAGVRGLAAQTKQALTGLAFQVTNTGDADNSQYAHSVVRYTSGQESAARTLASFIEGGADLQPVTSAGTGDVQLVLGRDFTGVSSAPSTSAPAVSGGAATTTPSTTSTVVGVTPPAEAACG
jgi:polyisoprenyl-teichoic acid--peptidoglycan teichoic acid transferase